jgi:hypothetical protein
MRQKPSAIGLASLALAGTALATGLVGATPARSNPRIPVPAAVNASLSEWKVELSSGTLPAGSVLFTVTNRGSIPHALEVEGRGIEQATPLIQPGGSATLALTLASGTYEIYCPVGQDSHKKLGMDARLEVVEAAAVGKSSAPPAAGPMPARPAAVKPISVTGGGPVIQILPGPFPFPDSAGPILQSFGPEHEALEGQIQNGPYSNNVVPIVGTFGFSAWEMGAVHDSVNGVAKFTTQDGARWKVVLDRVQTKDVPHHPKFGGVIRGLYYHGATGVHTPLVPTINSAVALWSIAHLYRNGALVSDSAYVHVMLLSHTRAAGSYALECWDCSRNPIDELQLQITPGPGQPKFAAPGGFLFVNWERSRSRTTAY